MANFPKAVMVAENYATLLYIPFKVVQNTWSIQLVFIFFEY